MADLATLDQPSHPRSLMATAYRDLRMAGLDKPNPARIWQMLLDDGIGTTADTNVVNALRAVDRRCGGLAEANEQFRVHAVTWLAGQAGIRQFIDCGPGTPRLSNYTHDIARRYQPDARVMYLDSDPYVLLRSEERFAGHPRIHIERADIFSSYQVMAAAVDHLVPSEPIALIHTATWPWYRGRPADAARRMAEFVDCLPIGSYTVMSHFFDPQVGGLTEHAQQLQQAFGRTQGGRFWAGDQIEAMFADQELIGPGVVACDDFFGIGDYYPNDHRARQCIAGGIGRVTHR